MPLHAGGQKDVGITVITGNGKGKTTSAIGLALEAVSQGQKAAIVQFLKGNSYAGELFAAQRSGVEIYQFGWGCHWSGMIRNGSMKCQGCGECFRQNRNPEHGIAPKGLVLAAELLSAGYSCVVLDEISHAVRHKLLDVNTLIELLNRFSSTASLILTGRQMDARLLEMAETAYELKEIKHPWRQGISSRRGIEY